MVSPLYQLNLTNLVWRGISTSIAAAVVLIFLGPAVDHHFVERQHNHSHIYLNGSAANHWHHESHPFEEPHSHPSTQADVAGHHDIIYQTSNDIIADFGTSSIIAIIGDPYPRIQWNRPFSRIQNNEETNLVEIVLMPPKRPPA